ncbi:hypothetical protein QJQ45_019960 [Haematococcus lacustris]|nr:hypothetical protein QJQ45_019960 [Haematococcus lacustris]
MLAGAGCVDGSASFRSPAPPKISRTSRRCDRAALRCAATLAAQPHPSSVQTSGWTYKYPHYPCASPCGVDDVRCQQMEALFQNVLNYPRLPCRLIRLLDQMTLDVHTMTATVEGLTHQYGPEMVLYLLRKQPNILQYDLNALVRNAEYVGAMLKLRRPDLFRVLTKNANLLCMEPQLVQMRYAGLHKPVDVPERGGCFRLVALLAAVVAAVVVEVEAVLVAVVVVVALLAAVVAAVVAVVAVVAAAATKLPAHCIVFPAQVLGVDAELVRALVIKFPPILNCDTEVVGRRMDVLHQLASSRTQWQEDVELISHNLLVFWLKDYIDLRARLEFLVAQKLSSSITLRMVFKTSNNTFARKYQGFREWKEEWKARRQAVASRRQAG